MIRAKWRLNEVIKGNKWGIDVDVRGNTCWTTGKPDHYSYTMTLYCTETGRSKVFPDIRIPYFDSEDMHRLMVDFMGEMV